VRNSCFTHSAAEPAEVHGWLQHAAQEPSSASVPAVSF
jgi:hypothetical protein